MSDAELLSSIDESCVANGYSSVCIIISDAATQSV